MPTVAILYDIGLIVTWVALYLRADFPSGNRSWLEFLLPNLGWFGLMMVKILAWPITAGHWLYRGRGPSTWKAITNLNGREVRMIVRVTSKS